MPLNPPFLFRFFSPLTLHFLYPAIIPPPPTIYTPGYGCSKLNGNWPFSIPGSATLKNLVYTVQFIGGTQPPVQGILDPYLRSALEPICYAVRFMILIFDSNSERCAQVEWNLYKAFDLIDSSRNFAGFSDKTLFSSTGAHRILSYHLLKYHV